MSIPNQQPSGPQPPAGVKLSLPQGDLELLDIEWAAALVIQPETFRERVRSQGIIHGLFGNTMQVRTTDYYEGCRRFAAEKANEKAVEEGKTRKRRGKPVSGEGRELEGGNNPAAKEGGEAEAKGGPSRKPGRGAGEAGDSAGEGSKKDRRRKRHDSGGAD